MREFFSCTCLGIDRQSPPGKNELVLQYSGQPSATQRITRALRA
jgi:hypothetical protein